jgi:hypothetical protein
VTPLRPSDVFRLLKNHYLSQNRSMFRPTKTGNNATPHITHTAILNRTASMLWSLVEAETLSAILQDEAYLNWVLTVSMLVTAGFTALTLTAGVTAPYGRFGTRRFRFSCPLPLLPPPVSQLQKPLSPYTFVSGCVYARVCVCVCVCVCMHASSRIPRPLLWFPRTGCVGMVSAGESCSAVAAPAPLLVLAHAEHTHACAAGTLRGPLHQSRSHLSLATALYVFPTPCSYEISLFLCPWCMSVCMYVCVFIYMYMCVLCVYV